MASPWQTLLACSTGAQEVVIVAPYMKASMLRRLLDNLAPDAAVECFTRWTPHDILVGSSDTACRTAVIQRGGTFYLHNRLHAKYYRFNKQTLVGSANVTRAGLNYQEAGNLEIICEPSQDFDHMSFEAELRKESREISEDEFEVWSRCPVEVAERTTDQPEEMGTAFDEWKPLTRYPEYLWLAHAEQWEDIPIHEQRELAKLDLSILRVPPKATREQFDLWIWYCLLAAPFVDSVLAVANEVPEVAWNFLSDRWGLDTRIAARALTTTQYWLMHFRPTGNE